MVISIIVPLYADAYSLPTKASVDVSPSYAWLEDEGNASRTKRRTSLEEAKGHGTSAQAFRYFEVRSRVIDQVQVEPACVMWVLRSVLLNATLRLSATVPSPRRQAGKRSVYHLRHAVP